MLKMFCFLLGRVHLSKTTEENKKRRSRLEKLKQQVKTQEKELNSQNVNCYIIYYT